jgi:hypothetical protein
MNTNLQDRTDRMLDQALEMTFPASDPISVYIPQYDNNDTAEPA